MIKKTKHLKQQDGLTAQSAICSEQISYIQRTGFYAKHVKYKKGEKRSQIEQDKILSAKLANQPMQPILDLKNALSVLISSEFLQMQDLVNECVSYVVLNLNDVVRLPIDMNCINHKLVWMIALKTPIDFLLNLHDKRDRLQSRLLKTKLAQFIALSMLPQSKQINNVAIQTFMYNNSLQKALDDCLKHDTEVNVFSKEYIDDQICHLEHQLRTEKSKQIVETFTELNEFVKFCIVCKGLYFDNGYFKQISVCSKAKPQIDFRGQLFLAHVPSKIFEFTEFVNFLEVDKKVLWKHLFCQLYMICLQFRCITCKHYFSGHELYNCSHHEKDPVFQQETDNFGKLPCCNSVIGKFDPQRADRHLQGCSKQMHQVDEEQWTSSFNSLQENNMRIGSIIKKVQNMHDEIKAKDELEGSSRVLPLTHYLEEFIKKQNRIARQQTHAVQHFKSQQQQVISVTKKRVKQRIKEADGSLLTNLINQNVRADQQVDQLNSHAHRTKIRLTKKNQKQIKSVFAVNQDHRPDQSVNKCQNQFEEIANGNQIDKSQTEVPATCLTDNRATKSNNEIGLLGNMKKKSVAKLAETGSDQVNLKTEPSSHAYTKPSNWSAQQHQSQSKLNKMPSAMTSNFVSISNTTHQGIQTPSRNITRNTSQTNLTALNKSSQSPNDKTQASRVKQASGRFKIKIVDEMNNSQDQMLSSQKQKQVKLLQSEQQNSDSDLENQRQFNDSSSNQSSLQDEQRSDNQCVSAANQLLSGRLTPVKLEHAAIEGTTQAPKFNSKKKKQKKKELISKASKHKIEVDNFLRKKTAKHVAIQSNSKKQPVQPTVISLKDQNQGKSVAEAEDSEEADSHFEESSNDFGQSDSFVGDDDDDSEEEDDEDDDEDEEDETASDAPDHQSQMHLGLPDYRDDDRNYQKREQWSAGKDIGQQRHMSGQKPDDSLYSNKKKKQTNMSILNEARSLNKLSYFLDPIPLLAPKKQSNNTQNSLRVPKKYDLDTGKEDKMETNNKHSQEKQKEFDFASHMQLCREEKIQQKLIKLQFLKYKRKKRLVFAEQEHCGQKVSDLIQAQNLNKIIIQDQLQIQHSHMQALATNTQKNQICATGHGFGSTASGVKNLEIPDFILQGPLFQNPVEVKMRQATQRNTQPGVQHQSHSPKKEKGSQVSGLGNNLQNYFGQLAMQMRPEKQLELRQKRQWRQDFLTNQYDPLQIASLTQELKQYRRPDKQFSELLKTKKQPK